MRLTLFFAAISLGLGLVLGLQSLGAVTETPAEKQDVVFKWALVASRLAEKHENIIPITRDTILESGDRFKMMVEAESDCFVYVLLKTSDGEILNLLPANTTNGATQSGPKKKTYIPDFDDWFTLDANTGLEKVYLLASIYRLKELELLLGEYETAPEAQRDSIASTILSSIKDMRRQNKRFKAKVARPLQIGGMFRGVRKSEGTSPDISSFAMKIQSEKFFAKTFTIEHK